MNPILLSKWLSLCEQAQIAYIPATFGPAVSIDEIYRFNEGLGDHQRSTKHTVGCVKIINLALQYGVGIAVVLKH